jgi:hypothetical protein
MVECPDVVLVLRNNASIPPMNQPILLDNSGRPISKAGFRSLIRRIWSWCHHWTELTILVLIIQTYILYRQANIMETQTSLMSREGKIAEAQKELAARPNIEASVDGPKAAHSSESVLWNIKNDGPYAIRHLRLRVLHFKKYVGLSWQDTISGESEVAPVLEAGGGTTVNLTSDFSPYTINDKENREYPTVQGAEFYVISLIFERAIDDKRYMYLQAFQALFPGEPPHELRLDLTSVSGPVATTCTMDAYAVELTYEFFKRNPRPYPVEPYNYHYLLGQPISICLETGPKSLRW